MPSERDEGSPVLRLQRSSGAIVLVACLIATAALAADGSRIVSEGKTIAMEGSAAGLPACSGCHGAAGEGQADSGFPRLAGLPAAYIARQLTSFGNGSRANAIMTPIAKMMDSGTMTDVAAYYAGIPPTSTMGKPLALDRAGEIIALHGDWSRGLPACAACHGAHGLGVGPAFPPIAGQSAAYITAQLQAWRSGSRHDDSLGLMHSVASHLDDAQIAAVAAYYETQPAISPGIARDPGAQP